MWIQIYNGKYTLLETDMSNGWSKYRYIMPGDIIVTILGPADDDDYYYICRTLERNGNTMRIVGMPGGGTRVYDLEELHIVLDRMANFLMTQYIG